MSQDGHSPDPDETRDPFDEIVARNPHMDDYLRHLHDLDIPRPKFTPHLTGEEAQEDGLNLIYPVGDPIFIHIRREEEGTRPHYSVLEPELEDYDGYHEILELILRYAPTEKGYETRDEFNEVIKNLLDRVTIQVDSAEEKRSLQGKATGGSRLPLFLNLPGNQKALVSQKKMKTHRVPVTRDELNVIHYRLTRDVMLNGPVEPLLRDPYIEDIHSIGVKNIHIVHKIFGMLGTNIRFRNRRELDQYLKNTSEKIGMPVSDAHPIVDAALPDGSRINIIYSRDVSREGSSFTIRKFTEKPPPFTQLIDWGTIDPHIAAYLWLCLENHMSIFISGETASGKTTTLNSMLSFIDFNHKIFTAEDTPEVVIPHPVWQRLITRETGAEESRVELFDLVKAALRSRPDYIIVGEIRGKEGSAAFQAMQTGHAVISTFHASSISRMIQRFVGEPINVPIRFMDNLNIALFQELLYINGRLARRCSSVQEVLRYSEAKGGVLTREIFTWDPVRDSHHFIGRFNSYVLESKVAEKLGYENVRDIYDELDRRAEIIRRMVDAGVLGYEDVNGIFRSYSEKGMAGIPREFRV